MICATLGEKGVKSSYYYLVKTAMLNLTAITLLGFHASIAKYRVPDKTTNVFDDHPAMHAFLQPYKH